MTRGSNGLMPAAPVGPVQAVLQAVLQAVRNRQRAAAEQATDLRQRQWDQLQGLFFPAGTTRARITAKKA